MDKSYNAKSAKSGQPSPDMFDHSINEAVIEVTSEGNAEDIPDSNNKLRMVNKGRNYINSNLRSK